MIELKEYEKVAPLRSEKPGWKVRLLRVASCIAGTAFIVTNFVEGFDNPGQLSTEEMFQIGPRVAAGMENIISSFWALIDLFRF